MITNPTEEQLTMARPCFSKRHDLYGLALDMLVGRYNKSHIALLITHLLMKMEEDHGDATVTRSHNEIHGETPSMTWSRAESATARAEEAEDEIERIRGSMSLSESKAMDRAAVAEQAASHYRAALERILAWDIPKKSGRRDALGIEVSYAVAFGLNGERDFIKGIAQDALAPPVSLQPVIKAADQEIHGMVGMLTKEMFEKRLEREAKALRNHRGVHWTFQVHPFTMADSVVTVTATGRLVSQPEETFPVPE